MTATTYLNNFKLPSIPAISYRALSDGFLVAVGVTMGILASFVVCLGLNLQKLSLCAPGNENVSPWRQPRWVAGFACVLVGSVIDFMAFGLAPQSLLAPLGALSLVWNLFMASYLLNEKYTRTDIVAVCLIFAGTALTVIFANHEEREFTLPQLKALYHEPRMMWYGVLVPLLLVAHYGLIYASKEYTFRSERTKRLAEVIGYAGFAGIAGGQSVLFAKSTVELLKDAAHGDDVFLHLETYMIIFMMTGSLLTQITFLNGGLKRFDSLYVVPVYQSYWIISGVVGGLVYFGEWEGFTMMQMFMFIVGTLITLSGLIVLTTKDHHNLDPSSFANGYAKVERGELDEFDPANLKHDSDSDSELELEYHEPGRISTGQHTVEHGRSKQVRAL